MLDDLKTKVHCTEENYTKSRAINEDKRGFLKRRGK
jgi:hypothetical protein